MNVRPLLAAPALLLLLGATVAQSQARGAEPASRPVQVLTRHEEFLSGNLALETLRIQTKYGLLEVPMADVLRIDFCPRLDREGCALLDRLVEDMKDAAKGTAASQAIRSLGPGTLRALRAAAATADEPQRPALRALIEELREKAGARNLDDDVIVTRRFTVLGTAEIDDLSLACGYGSLRVRRADMERLVLSGGSAIELVNRILIIKTWTDADEEYAHTQDCISRRAKIRMTEFTGTSAGELKKAIARHRVVVIPELEEGGDAPQVAADSAAALKKFVQGGGVVISCGGETNIAFLTQSGILPCANAGGDSTQASVQKRHPIVQGVSGAVPYANATIPIHPTGKSKFQTLLAAPTGGAVVGVARVGDGAVVYCGWDFYEVAEPHEKILANAVRWATGQMQSGLQP